MILDNLFTVLAHSVPGSSGSPIFDERKMLVGLVRRLELAEDVPLKLADGSQNLSETATDGQGLNQLATRSITQST